MDHAQLDDVLKASVKDRRVDYAAVVKERAKLDAYLKQVASAAAPADANEALAAWVNAYNATVVASFLDHGLDKTKGKVVDVKGFFDAEKHKVFGVNVTLNELEEVHVRRLDKSGRSADPRVHFVVNCASRDCPPLRARAYAGKTIAADLEEQTRAYLTRAGEVAVDDAAHRIVVVQIFEWYAGDFGGEDGARNFIAKYVPALASKLADDATWDLDFRPYDWTANAV